MSNTPYLIQTCDAGTHRRKDRPNGGMYISLGEVSLTIAAMQPQETVVVRRSPVKHFARRIRKGVLAIALAAVTFCHADSESMLDPVETMEKPRLLAWGAFGYAWPSHRDALTWADIVMLILYPCAMCIIFGIIYGAMRAKEGYDNGYQDGVYSKIVSLAKLRYGERCGDIVLVNVYLPENIWDIKSDEFNVHNRPKAWNSLVQHLRCVRCRMKQKKQKGNNI